MKLYFLLPLLLLVACSKTPPQVATPAVGVNNGVALPTPVTVIPELAQPAHKAPALLPVVVKAHPKKLKATTARKTARDSELEARATILIQETRGDCLLVAVDRKLNWDVATNEVHDLGNVRTAPVCAMWDQKDKVLRAKAKEFLKANDPKKVKTKK